MSNTSIHSRSLYAGDFPELQAQFLSEFPLREGGLRGGIVLVPNVLCGLSLRRELARTGTSHANVHFRTLTEHLLTLAGPWLAESGQRLLPEAIRPPLMKRAVEQAGSLRYFHRMAHRAGFQRAAWQTIHELRAAGLSANDLQAMAQRPQLELLLQQKLSDLAAIWRAFDHATHQYKFVDRAVTMEWACNTQQKFTQSKVVGSPAHPLVIYGLDDLSAMERRFIARLMEACDVVAYLPFRASDAYIWSEPLYQWYLEQGFAAELLEPDARAEVDNSLTRVQLGVFEDLSASSLIPHPSSLLSPSGGGATSASSLIPHPSSLLSPAGGGEESSFFIISAANRENEVEEILREILFSPPARNKKDDESEARSAVLMRDSGNYIHLFRDEWSQAGITSYFHECRKLGESTAGRSLRCLAKLLKGEFRRSDVMEFLLSAPLRPLADQPTEAGEAAVVEWNHFSLQAMIVAGDKSWRENLRRLRNQLIKELERREWELDDPASSIKRQLASLALFEHYVERLIAGTTSARAATTWKDLAEAVSKLFTEFVESSDETEIIGAELALAEWFDALGVPPNAAEFSTFVETILSQPLAREGKFEVHEPTVARIADTLGVLFDEVFVCGLVEKEFPRPWSQDPLLLDDERVTLQRALNAKGNDFQIPLRSRARFQERFLFRTVVNSARRRLVLSYPRVEPVQGREWLASTYLLHALEAVTGMSADYESLESFVRTSPQARRVSINRFKGRSAKHSLNSFEYDLTKLGSALQSKVSDGVAYLFCADEQFQRAVLAERSRYRTREFTAFDGSLENSPLRSQLHASIAQLPAAKIQRYASCPYEYFVQHVLELEGAAEPHWIQPLNPGARGMLLHEILEKFYRAEIEANHWPLSRDAGARLEQVASETFAEFERLQVPGLPLLWKIEQSKLRQKLRAFFETELATASPFQPRYFNAAYGMSEGDPQLSREQAVRMPLQNGLMPEVHGKIDRVDISPTGTARLIDYTAKNFDKLQRDAKQINGGIAPHVARLAASALGLDVDEFAYYSLEADDSRSIIFSRDGWEESQERVSQFIGAIVKGMNEGKFFPSPTNHCQYCKAKTACGSGRFTQKWDYDLPQTAGLRILRGGEA